jgi:hypothetical protein
LPSCDNEPNQDIPFSLSVSFIFFTYCFLMGIV